MGGLSQSLRADQGNSDFREKMEFNARRPGRNPSVLIRAIPTPGSTDYIEIGTGSKSQSLRADQGNSDLEGLDAKTRKTMETESRNPSVLIRAIPTPAT